MSKHLNFYFKKMCHSPLRLITKSYDCLNLYADISLLFLHVKIQMGLRILWRSPYVKISLNICYFHIHKYNHP